MKSFYGILAVALMLVIVACNTTSMTPDEASRWIAAYTPAHVDRDSKIRIELTDLMRSRIDTTRSLEKSFSFSPRIKGTAHYSADERHIDFIPSESLRAGRKYKCRVRMKEITGVDSLPDFAFDFYVDTREIRFEDVVTTIDPDNMSMMKVGGRLEYSVPAGDSITGVNSFMICDYPGAKIVMDKVAYNNSRGFKITGIKRQTKDAMLTLSINPIGGFPPVECKVVVPSVADFKLLDAKRVEASEPYLNLEFSNPISSQQDLDGLISIDNVENLRIQREGTNVKVFYGKNGFPDITLRISDAVKNTDGVCLNHDIERHFPQEIIPPAIEIPFEGTILPDNHNLKLPFRTVNLAAVDVEVVKIFPSNVMPFLQDNNYDGTTGQRRFGRLIYHRTVRLDKDKSLNLHQWQNFSIDLKNLFRQERGAVYNIRLTYCKAYSLYGKNKVDDFEGITRLTDDDRDRWDEAYPYIYRDAPDYDVEKFNWDEVNDPAKDTYYMVEWDRMPEVNLVASNLGLIVKQTDDNVVKAIVTDLVSATPAAGVTVCAYNYQLQEIGTAVTDANGFADLKTSGKPFMVTACDGYSTTYLKVKSGHELSTSNFDVSGKTVTGGIKGFTYGERGVWRPGDDIHLALIVEDKDNKLPNNHPVVMELYNPNEQLYVRHTLSKGVGGFYVFHIPTEESMPTGLWHAKFKVGNETFHHPVRIETIKPNRLKISIKTPKIIQAGGKTPIGLEARWLTGPVAKGMSASVEMTLYPDATPFKSYKKYTFKNPLVTYASSQKSLYNGTLDSLGVIDRNCTIAADINSPGMLLANITAKVNEPGGDASITSTSVPFSPFGVYVGIDLSHNSYETDTDIKLPVVVVNQLGARMKTRELDYKIYRLDWNWWWEGGDNDLNRYVQSTTVDVIASGTVTVANGVGSIPFKVEYPGWGRYLVLVRDTKGGHATGGVITVDWPQWRGRSEKGSAAGSTELSFTLDKPQYEVGETANVYLPKCHGGKVLLSIENGSRIIKRMWVLLSGSGETKFPLYIDRNMAPNFYVTATMLRPHRETDFNTPIRLFGVQSVKVVNQKSILHPVIDMPDEIHPQTPVTIRIRECDNKPMTYTLAIVDEGLLDITNFKTPRPWNAMNQKEALGVKTWDMFDEVIGAFGSNFRSIHSVGGDEALRKATGMEKRFNPVVKFLGPFTLAGGAKTHKITMPNYVGSVRVMVVAAHNGSYGNMDKTVKVTSPLMLLTTLPRTLANCDTVNMPVNVFAMDNNINRVTVNISAQGPVKILGASSNALSFAQRGEKLLNFKLVCDRVKEGRAKIIVTASGGSHVATDTTFIDVSNPMPVVLETIEKTVAAGKSVDLSWTPMTSGKVSLQVASMPMPDFTGISTFMEYYPHLCTEQLSSKALFMLYDRGFLDANARKNCENELPQVLKAIKSRQLQSGGFSYWPGQTSDNQWVTSMAGLALFEASRQGYRIDENCLERWKKYQESTSRNYKYSLATDIAQAFRLYSMAVADVPVTSAMNRLRESKQLTRAAAYTLACAYAEAGRIDVAMKLIDRAERTEQASPLNMFSSDVRDLALEMDAYALCGESAKALDEARSLASMCSAQSYVTQDIAFTSIAFNHLVKKIGKSGLSVRIAEQGEKPLEIFDTSCVKEIALNPGSGKLSVENLNSKGILSLSLLKSYRPAPNAAINPYARGLNMSVRYVDLKGNPISIAKLKQNTEFKVLIKISNTGSDVDNLAISYAIPSGWEIWNGRLFDNSETGYDNVDIRDEVAHFYVGLNRGSTKTVELRLRAAYTGNYLLPPTVCEDMYNPTHRAVTSNRRVSVIL